MPSPRSLFCSLAPPLKRGMARQQSSRGAPASPPPTPSQRLLGSSCPPHLLRLLVAIFEGLHHLPDLGCLGSGSLGSRLQCGILPGSAGVAQQAPEQRGAVGGDVQACARHGGVGSEPGWCAQKAGGACRSRARKARSCKVCVANWPSMGAAGRMQLECAGAPWQAQSLMRTVAGLAGAGGGQRLEGLGIVAALERTRGVKGHAACGSR